MYAAVNVHTHTHIYARRLYARAAKMSLGSMLKPRCYQYQPVVVYIRQCESGKSEKGYSFNKLTSRKKLFLYKCTVFCKRARKNIAFLLLRLARATLDEKIRLSSLLCATRISSIRKTSTREVYEARLLLCARLPRKLEVQPRYVAVRRRTICSGWRIQSL